MSTCKYHLAKTIAAVSCLAVPFLAKCDAQEMYFPGTEWTRVAPEAELMDSATLEDAVALLEANSSFNGVETLAIIRNGRMIWSGSDIEAQYWTASAAKSFTSTVLGLLIDDGNVHLGPGGSPLRPPVPQSWAMGRAAVDKSELGG